MVFPCSIESCLTMHELIIVLPKTKVKCPRNNIVQINSSLYMHCVSWLSDSRISLSLRV